MKKEIKQPEKRPSNPAPDVVKEATDALLPPENMFQNVFITLKDGRVGMFTGPALTLASEKEVHIKNVQMGKPAPLPDAETWNQLIAEEANKDVPAASPIIKPG